MQMLKWSLIIPLFSCLSLFSLDEHEEPVNIDPEISESYWQIFGDDQEDLFIQHQQNPNQAQADVFLALTTLSSKIQTGAWGGDRDFLRSVTFHGLSIVRYWAQKK